jgi:hypothetical protein
MKFIIPFIVLLIFRINGFAGNPVFPGSLCTGGSILKSNFPEQDIPPVTSLVYPGTDGRLVYIADSLGNKIPDFSNAGYKGGGVSIPYVSIREIIWPVLGDNSASIQAAIDRVSALTPDASGFRGAVLLKMGTYELEKPLNIKASGVVLRGEGMSDIGTILIGKIPKERPTGPFGRSALVNIGGASGCTPQEETKQLITDKYVPLGARNFNVTSARAFKPGDKVLVRRIGNQEWIKELGEDSLGAGRFRWRPFNISWDRIITDVKGNNITIDAPVFCAIDTRWGGGEIVRCDDQGRIEQVGIENLRGVSEYNPSVRMKAYGNMDRGSFDERDKPHYEGDEYYSDENHYFNFISIVNAKNAWVRNISSLHFASSVVTIAAGTKWITIQDCESREPVSIRAGARRFTYQLNGQLALVQRCFSQKGRHSFVMQNSGSSGNVFLDCRAVNPYSTSEPHSMWVTGALYDNIKAPLTARYWKDISIGWAGANIVFWNCEGDFLIQKPPTAQNYSFGHIGINAVIFNALLQDLTKPNGHVESMDRHVTPRSLYLTQLRERSGPEAVKNVTQQGQEAE